jgi:hypothetical protein
LRLALLHRFEVPVMILPQEVQPEQMLLVPVLLEQAPLLVLLLLEQAPLLVLRTLCHHLGDRLRRALSVLPLIAVRRF